MATPPVNERSHWETWFAAYREFRRGTNAASPGDMDTTKNVRITHGSLTTWENGPAEVNAGHCAKLQIRHDSRWVGGKATRAQAILALAEMLEQTACQLREMAKEEG